MCECSSIFYFYYFILFYYEVAKGVYWFFLIKKIFKIKLTWILFSWIMLFIKQNPPKKLWILLKGNFDSDLVSMEKKMTLKKLVWSLLTVTPSSRDFHFILCRLLLIPQFLAVLQLYLKFEMMAWEIISCKTALIAWDESLIFLFS